MSDYSNARPIRDMIGAQLKATSRSRTWRSGSTGGLTRSLDSGKEGLMPQYTRDPADDGRETRAAKLREQLDLHVKALLDLPPQSAAKYHAYGVIEGLRYALDLEEEVARAS